MTKDFTKLMNNICLNFEQLRSNLRTKLAGTLTMPHRPILSLMALLFLVTSVGSGEAPSDWVAAQLDAFAVPPSYRSGWTDLVGDDADAAQSHEAVEFVQRTRQNADAGRSAEQFLFGVMAHFGDGIPQNPIVAADYLRRAAGGGHTKAQAALGLVLARGGGAGVERKVASAMRWLRLAAVAGEVDAQFHLGKMIQIGLNATAGFSDALRWYAKAAARGHIGGMFELAVAFEYNRGLAGIAQPAQLASAKWRTQQAASLYERAAAQGHAESRYHLALMYFYGRYDENTKEGAALSGAAGGGGGDGGDDGGRAGADATTVGGSRAEGSDAAAGAAAAPVRMTPFGVNAMAEPEHQYRKAAALFKEGAEGGHGPSEYYLATQYINGLGMDVDYELGTYWLARAAKVHLDDHGGALWEDMSGSASVTLKELRELISEAKDHSRSVVRKFDEL